MSMMVPAGFFCQNENPNQIMTEKQGN